MVVLVAAGVVVVAAGVAITTSVCPPLDAGAVVVVLVVVELPEPGFVELVVVLVELVELLESGIVVDVVEVVEVVEVVDEEVVDVVEVVDVEDDDVEDEVEEDVLVEVVVVVNGSRVAPQDAVCVCTIDRAIGAPAFIAARSLARKGSVGIAAYAGSCVRSEK